MSHKGARLALVVLELFVAVGAIAGGIALLRGTFIQGIPVAWLAGTPFSDYIVLGLATSLWMMEYRNQRLLIGRVSHT